MNFNKHFTLLKQVTLISNNYHTEKTVILRVTRENADYGFKCSGWLCDNSIERVDYKKNRSNKNYIFSLKRKNYIPQYRDILNLIILFKKKLSGIIHIINNSS